MMMTQWMRGQRMFRICECARRGNAEIEFHARLGPIGRDGKRGPTATARRPRIRTKAEKGLSTDALATANPRFGSPGPYDIVSLAAQPCGEGGQRGGEGERRFFCPVDSAATCGRALDAAAAAGCDGSLRVSGGECLGSDNFAARTGLRCHGQLLALADRSQWPMPPTFHECER